MVNTNNNLINLANKTAILIAMYINNESSIASSITILALFVTSLIVVIALYLSNNIPLKRNLQYSSDKVNIYLGDKDDEQNEFRFEIKNFKENNESNNQKVLEVKKSKESNLIKSEFPLTKTQSKEPRLIVENELYNSSNENDSIPKIIPHIVQSEASYNNNSEISEISVNNSSKGANELDYIALDNKSSDQTTLWTTYSMMIKKDIVNDNKDNFLNSVSHTSMENFSMMKSSNMTISIKEGEKPFENDSVWTNSSEIKPGNSNLTLKITPSRQTNKTNNSALTSDNMTINLQEGEKPFENDSIWTAKTQIPHPSCSREQSNLTLNTLSTADNKTISGNFTIYLGKDEKPFENDSVWTTKVSKLNNNLGSCSSIIDTNEDTISISDKAEDTIKICNNQNNNLIRNDSEKILNSIDNFRSKDNSKDDLNEIQISNFENDLNSSKVQTPDTLKSLKKSQTEVNLKDMKSSSFSSNGIISSKSFETHFTIKNSSSNLSLRKRLEYNGPIINSVKSNQSSIGSNTNQTSIESGSIVSSSSSKQSSLVKDKVQLFEQKNLTTSKRNFQIKNNLEKNVSFDELKFKLEKVSSSVDY